VVLDWCSGLTWLAADRNAGFEFTPSGGMIFGQAKVASFYGNHVYPYRPTGQVSDFQDG